MAQAKETSPYHHGDLANALREAALDLARSEGPEGISMRAVTRRVGVSPAAAYRHFADRRALIVSAARRANVLLSRSMLQATDELTGPTARNPAVDLLRGVGLGYIRFALTEPGWAALAFTAQGEAAAAHEPTTPLIGVDSDTPSPFDLLVGALDAMVDAGALTPERRRHAEWPCWATVHGFGELVGRGPLRRLPRPAIDQLAHQCVDTIIVGLDVRD